MLRFGRKNGLWRAITYYCRTRSVTVDLDVRTKWHFFSQLCILPMRYETIRNFSLGNNFNFFQFKLIENVGMFDRSLNQMVHWDAGYMQNHWIAVELKVFAQRLDWNLNIFPAISFAFAVQWNLFDFCPCFFVLKMNLIFHIWFWFVTLVRYSYPYVAWKWPYFKTTKFIEQKCGRISVFFHYYLGDWNSYGFNSKFAGIHRIHVELFESEKRNKLFSLLRHAIVLWWCDLSQ